MNGELSSRLAAMALSAALVLFTCGCSSDKDDSSAGDAGNVTPSPTEAESSGTAVPEDPRGTSKAFTDKTIADVPAENTVSVDELYAILETGDAYVLDCRAISKHMRGMIEGSVCITAGSILEVRNREIPTDTDIYIIDQANDKVAEVFFTLDALGFDRAKLHAVDGGMQAWVDAGYPTVLGATAPC